MTNWTEVISWSVIGVMILGVVCARIYVFAARKTRDECAKLCDHALAMYELQAAGRSGRERDLELGGADAAKSLAESIRGITI